MLPDCCLLYTQIDKKADSNIKIGQKNFQLLIDQENMLDSGCEYLQSLFKHDKPTWCYQSA